jgi:hypothetical protein
MSKWIGGSGAGLTTWADAFTGSTLNSLAAGNAIISDLLISNNTPLDMFGDISIHLASAAFAAPAQIALYIYPLNRDGSTFGDGRYFPSGIPTAAAGPPAAHLLACTMQLVAATQAQDNIFTGIQLPPRPFRWVLYNPNSVALASSGNLCQYQTYNIG